MRRRARLEAAARTATAQREKGIGEARRQETNVAAVPAVRRQVVVLVPAQQTDS